MTAGSVIKLINTFVHRIYLYDDKLLIIYNYSNRKTNTHEESLISFAEGECSDINAYTPPNKKDTLAVSFLFGEVEGFEPILP